MDRLGLCWPRSSSSDNKDNSHHDDVKVRGLRHEVSPGPQHGHLQHPLSLSQSCPAILLQREHKRDRCGLEGSYQVDCQNWMYFYQSLFSIFQILCVWRFVSRSSCFQLVETGCKTLPQRHKFTSSSKSVSRSNLFCSRGFISFLHWSDRHGGQGLWRNLQGMEGKVPQYLGGKLQIFNNVGESVEVAGSLHIASENVAFNP